jgi:hypothetical protein
MIELTAEANRRLEDYLRRMHARLRGSRSIEPQEIEQNVREHVAIALAAVPAPVGPESLSQVLEQLGPPERWLPDDERPLWRRVTATLMAGPEDWRLAYLSLGLMVLMAILFPVGGIVLLLPAFLVARATVEVIGDRGEALGPRRWLVLPPIFIVVAFLFGTALFVPIAGFAAWVIDGGGFPRFAALMPAPAATASRESLMAGEILIAAGAWWIVLSGLFALLRTQIQTLVRPFAARWRGRHALVLTVCGATLIAIGATLLF